jgi:GntR family transcriptional regulator, N-acetylglucosamine utilization regulator
MSIRIDLDKLEAVVDRSAPVPLYYQFKQWLSAGILAGDLAPGTRLPEESELCTRLGVSRGVVRQALTELGYEGLIYRQRGRGTFVSEPKTAEGLISGVRGLADDAAERGQAVSSKVVLLREAPAAQQVARSLSLAPGTPVVELERVRALDGEPHVLVMTYLPAELVPGLAERDLSGPASLYQILREEYRLSVISGRRRVEAAAAGPREAHLLGIRRGDPLLVLRSIGYTTGRRPLDYFIAFHRGDKSAFEIELGSAADGASGRFERVPVAQAGPDP